MQVGKVSPQMTRKLEKVVFKSDFRKHVCSTTFHSNSRLFSAVFPGHGFWSEQNFFRASMAGLDDDELMAIWMGIQHEAYRTLFNDHRHANLPAYPPVNYLIIAIQHLSSIGFTWKRTV